ncbi:MAG: NTP transferase domain-containing protein [Actinobacteria bacterium]|nr:NTP transferase domain-containing protein [Actinomycetota bacterium]
MSDFGKKISAIILAAGIGKRMKSDKPKVLHEICFKPVIYYILNAVLSMDPRNVFVVVGYKGDMVKDYLARNFPSVRPVYQEKQLGTANAVLSVAGNLNELAENCIVLTGDMPLITGQVLSQIAAQKLQMQSGMIAASAFLNNPYGYGRIIRDRDGSLLKVVEEADATQEQKKINEINSSIYCFDTGMLFKYLSEIEPHNSQNEFYLTDVVEKFSRSTGTAGIFTLKDSMMSEGFNDMLQLENIEKIMQVRINKEHMLSGVRIRNTETTYIDPETKIGKGTVIEPFCLLKGNTTIEENCIIGPFTQITESVVRQSSVINKSVVRFSIVKPGSNIGPDSFLNNEK